MGAGVETAYETVKPASIRRSVALDDAFAAGGFEILAHLISLIAVCERPHHGAVECPAITQIHPLESDLGIAEHVCVFRLQLPPGGLRVLLVLLRGHLHHIAARRGVAARPRRSWVGISLLARRACRPAGRRLVVGAVLRI